MTIDTAARAPFRESTQTDASAFLLHEVEVAGVVRLSPSFVRVTLRGPSLDRFADNGFDQRIKLFFPAPDGSLDALPFSDDWYDVWRGLDEQRRPPIRTYTIRAVRQATREVDVDLVLHGATGPASAWAEDCVPGDRIIVLGPNDGFDGVQGGVDFHPPAHAERILIVGDETALPAIANTLERLPADARGVVIVEVPHAGDRELIGSHDGFSITALAREGAPHGSLLVPAVRGAAGQLVGRCAADVEVPDIDLDTEILWEVPADLQTDSTDLYAWLAGESGTIKTLRRHLVGECGVDRRSVAFMGYWREGHVL